MTNKIEDDKLYKTGKKLENIGCVLTLVVTVPILATMFFGVIGLVMGIVFAVIVIIALLSKKAKGK